MKQLHTVRCPLGLRRWLLKIQRRKALKKKDIQLQEKTNLKGKVCIYDSAHRHCNVCTIKRPLQTKQPRCSQIRFVILAPHIQSKENRRIEGKAFPIQLFSRSDREKSVDWHCESVALSPHWLRKYVQWNLTRPRTQTFKRIFWRLHQHRHETRFVWESSDVTDIFIQALKVQVHFKRWTLFISMV